MLRSSSSSSSKCQFWPQSTVPSLTTSPELLCPIMGTELALGVQWRRVSPSKAPHEAKLPLTQVTFGLQLRDKSSPICCRLHAWGRLYTEPSRLVAQELAPGWLAADHRQLPALEPHTFSRVEETQSTRNTSQGAEQVPGLAADSSATSLLPSGIAAASLHALPAR